MIKREELTNPQSCMSRALDDEMTFVLLGRDPTAPGIILEWIRQRIWRGKNKQDDPQILEALACAETMMRQRESIRLRLSAPAPSPSPVQARTAAPAAEGRDAP